MSKQDPLFNQKKQGRQGKQNKQGKQKATPPDQFKKIRGGRISAGGSNPLPKGGKGGSIQTNWKTINWTPKKLLIASILIGVPYLAGVIASLLAGLTMITFILIGLGLFVGILYGILRWLEQAEL
ncbi:MAG: hypothetical protein Kow0049_32290 [Stanieria sp.]